MTQPDTSLLYRIVCLIVALTLSGCKDDEQWKEFKSQHHCTVVAHIDPSTGWGAHGPVSNPPMDGWLCDDGITYYKQHEDNS